MFKSYMLTTDITRQTQGLIELNQHGIVPEIFRSIPGETPFESFNKSQHAMLSLALTQSHEDPIMFFEDDVIFKNTDHLYQAYSELPRFWDVLYLGANLTHHKAIQKHSSNLVRVKGAWTTHAVLYSPDMIDFIVGKYNWESGRMFDDWLSEEISHDDCLAFCVNPMICWQRPGKSDLWGRQTDYTDCFIEGNKMMAAL